MSDFDVLELFTLIMAGVIILYVAGPPEPNEGKK